MAKIIPEHLDAIGRPLAVGDPVACAWSKTSLLIGRITALGEKQVRVVDFNEPDRSPSQKYSTLARDWVDTTAPNGKLRYPQEVVLLDGPDITMYLLKLSHKK